MKSLLYIAVIIIATIAGKSAFGLTGGIAGFIISLAFGIFMMRAQIIFFIGQNKYIKNHQSGIKLMEKAYMSGKLPPRQSLMFAYLVLRDGDVDKAEKLINKITYLKKKELKYESLMTAKINQALILWKKGDLKQAIEMLEEIYSSGYKTTVLYGTLGYFYILDGQISKALDFNNEAYEYNGTNMIIEDNLASNCMLAADYDRAEELYNKLFTQNPEFIEPYYNYALLMKTRGNRQQAAEYFNKALQYPEKFLSTVTHDQIKKELEALTE